MFLPVYRKCFKCLAGLGGSLHVMYLGEISPRKIRGIVTLTSATFSSLGKLSGQFFGLRYMLIVNLCEMAKCVDEKLNLHWSYIQYIQWDQMGSIHLQVCPQTFCGVRAGACASPCGGLYTIIKRPWGHRGTANSKLRNCSLDFLVWAFRHLTQNTRFLITNLLKLH